MNMYETVVILKPNVKDKEKEKYEIFHTILHGIRPEDDTIKACVHRIDDMGEKNLAYEIKGCKKGYYIIFYYQTESERITQLETALRINDNVLKFLSLKMDEDEVFERSDIDTDHIMTEQDLRLQTSDY